MRGAAARGAAGAGGADCAGAAASAACAADRDDGDDACLSRTSSAATGTISLSPVKQNAFTRPKSMPDWH